MQTVNDAAGENGAQAADFGDISLRSLQVFVAVEETGSMTLAAARLGASRSGVSQQITNLELTLGASLFDRVARPMVLTPVGAVLRRHAHHILEAVSAARTELLELSLSALVELRLGIIDDLDASVTPELVSHIRSLYPRCQLSVNSGRSDSLTSALVKRQDDVVLTGVLPDDMSHFEDYPILRESFIIAAARGALAGGEGLRRELETAPFVRYTSAMPMGQLINQHLRRLRIELPAPFAFDASRSVFAMMQKCGGWTITTPLCLRDAAQERDTFDYFRLPFAGFTRTIRLVARREELGHLPGRLASLCRRLIAEQIVPGVRSVAPWTDDALVVLANDGEPLTKDAAIAAAEAGSCSAP